MVTGSSSPSSVSLAHAPGSGRSALEDFIRQVFASAYAARVSECMPVLLGLYDTQDKVQAALGLRFAQPGRLFLENYLDRPVDTLLAAQLGQFGKHYAPDRAHIVEVGNLAASCAGGTRWLIIALTALLQGAGYEWVVFTATRALRNAFNRLGLYMHPLGAADPACLPEAVRVAWGSYYTHDPFVMAVNVQHTFGILDRYLRLERALTALRTIWQQSYHIGSQISVSPTRLAS